MNKNLAVLHIIVVPFFAAHAQSFDTVVPQRAADNSSVPKISFEQQTGMLVLDVGKKPGFVDPEDNLTDLAEACGIVDSSIIPKPAQIIADKSFDPSDLTRTVAAILTKVGLGSLNFNMSPVIGSEGKDDQPIFILFPEKHLNSPVSTELGNLHANLAVDMLKLTAKLDEQNIKILNTMEGPQGSWVKQFDLDPRDLADRKEQANMLMETKRISGGQLIGEIYSDRVATQYHDSNDLTIKYVLSLQAYIMSFQPDKTSLTALWAQAKSYLLSRFPVRSKTVNVDSYQKYFQELVSLQPESVKRINSELCEERSREMARYTYSLAKKEGARVVYVSFGALHTHGVVEQLETYSASTIVFSPNL